MSDDTREKLAERKLIREAADHLAAPVENARHIAIVGACPCGIAYIPLAEFPDSLDSGLTLRCVEGHAIVFDVWSPEDRRAMLMPESAAPVGEPEKVTRVEVIDETGRVFTRWNTSIELAYQDDGRTLKVFVQPSRRSHP